MNPYEELANAIVLQAVKDYVITSYSIHYTKLYDLVFIAHLFLSQLGYQHFWVNARQNTKPA